MRKVFVDTSAWVALLDSGDKYHEDAVEKLKLIIQKRWQLITSSDVLDETYTLLLMNTNYSQVIKFRQQLKHLASAQLLITQWVTPEISEQGWEIFARFNQDKQWSFTDCTSYAVMRNLDLDMAFTFDHHFVQMGKSLL
ncbi:MAG: PIN domain-containing protein [Anaerolineae bacterium]|nr:PIN domain-containing protein [Anaerolineae bacterium]